MRGDVRAQTDQLWPTPLGPRELEALQLIEQRPGITVGELRDALGITRGRVWQIVYRLQRPAVLVGDAGRARSGKSVARLEPETPG